LAKDTGDVRMNKVDNISGRCKMCGAKLSLYNQNELCFPCQEKQDAFEIATGRPYSSSFEFFSYLREKIKKAEYKVPHY